MSPSVVFPARQTIGPALQIPPGRRSPFGWQTFALSANGQGSARLFWPTFSLTGNPGWLRITTATDDRERRNIGVRLASSLRPLGVIELQQAHALETFALSLPATDMAAAIDEGVELSLLPPSTTPIWFLHPEIVKDAPGMAPSLLMDEPTTSLVGRLLRRLASLDSLHTWGWMEGCVLDAQGWLNAAFPSGGYAIARQLHLRQFFPPDGSLRAETARGEPCDDRIDSIESTLMFAALAADQPDHPWLDMVMDWWLDRIHGTGAILDGHQLTAEGSYTIAYPMARLAFLRDRTELAQIAVTQIASRHSQLWHDGALWLRWSPQSGTRSFRNWGRGLAWHFLGSVRTAKELRGKVAIHPIVAGLPRLADLALANQRQDGLWNCFIDDDTTSPETSGTAGIAAALALAAQEGWIAAEPALSAASRAHDSLVDFIRPDGLLDGVAQANRGGEELQRSSYRVLSSMAAGLFGQLHASLSVSRPNTLPHSLF